MAKENQKQIQARVKALGLGSGLFQKLLFVMLFTLFVTFIGYREGDFVHNLLITMGLMLGSWIIVKVLLRLNK